LPARIPIALARLFKKADLISAYFEATQLAGFETNIARRLFIVPAKSMTTPRLVPLATREAQGQFLERFRRLTA
jgi:hypothetical protein